MTANAAVRESSPPKTLGDILGIERYFPKAADFVDLSNDDEGLTVLDTEGRVIGVIDLASDWANMDFLD